LPYVRHFVIINAMGTGMYTKEAKQ
jgi:hypothetical protein